MIIKFPSQDIISLCERIEALMDETKQMDRKLRNLIKIDELSLEQCNQLLDIVPACYTLFKIVERIEELEITGKN